MVAISEQIMPRRKLLLMASETALFTGILFLGVALPPLASVPVNLAEFSPTLFRALLTSFTIALICQAALSYNDLYDWKSSQNRSDLPNRLVHAAGYSLVILAVLVSILPRSVFVFPGFADAAGETWKLIVLLVFSFFVIYCWRLGFHWFFYKWRFGEQVIVLGTGSAARQLADLIESEPMAGFEVVGLVGPPTESFEEDPDPLNVLAPGVPTPPEWRAKAPASRPSRVQQSGQGGKAEPDGAGGGVSVAPPQPSKSDDKTQRTAAAASQESDGTEDISQTAKPLRHHAWLGNVEELPRLAAEHTVSRVVVALQERRGRLPIEELLACRMSGMVVEERESMYERITGKIAVQSMRPSYLIFGRGFAKEPLLLVMKRVLDIVASLLGLIVSLPVSLLAILAIRLDGRGPILFRQDRVGQDGQVFQVLKFRTMRVDAEKESGPVWAKESDPRITRVGKFLRMSRVDEIPQMFNVLTGRMSFVGPRPERPYFVDQLSKRIPYYPLRHTAKPGLTGWAQVRAPYGASVDDAMDKLRYDLYYIKNMSPLFDLSIMLRTVGVILFRKGAR